MLIDPRGVVHATTGLLPVKSIAVPPEHYQPAMDSLRSVFKTGPLLMPRGGIAVPLPVESGYSWSWIGKENDEWQAVPHHPVIEKPDLIAAIGVAGAQLWDRLVDLGRLMPEDHADRAVLMPGAEGAPGDRFTDLGLTPAEVETALHRLARWIEGADTHSGFEGRAMVRDGWLQLRPLPQLAGTAKLSADQEDDG